MPAASFTHPYFESSVVEALTPMAVWQAMQSALKAAVSPASYQTWLAGIQPMNWESNLLTLGVDSQFKKAWVEKHYGEPLQHALHQSGQPHANILLKVSETETVAQSTLFPNVSEGLSVPAEEPVAPASYAAFLQQAPSHQTLHPQLSQLAYNARPLNPRYRWETLITGTHNQFAVAAGQAVASQPAGEPFGQFNPLCIHGGTGLGKTHLLQAMAHQLQHAGHQVCYVTAEQFTNELIAAVGKKQWQPFRNRYRQVDVLLIDDVQFLGGKERTQQEFFHTLNTLVEAGKQVVLSCDRPPAELDMLDARLRSRFEMGLLVEVTPPAEAARREILHAKAVEAGLRLDELVINFLAVRFNQHVRQLEGAINKVQAMQLLAGLPPTLAAVQQQFGYPPAVAAASSSTQSNSCRLGSLISTVAQYYDVTEDQLCGAQRGKQVALARQVAFYLARRLTGASHAEIGRAVGGRQHSTVVHAVAKVQQQLVNGSQPRLAEQIESLSARLQHECLL